MPLSVPLAFGSTGPSSGADVLAARAAARAADGADALAAGAADGAARAAARAADGADALAAGAADGADALAVLAALAPSNAAHTAVRQSFGSTATLVGPIPTGIFSTALLFVLFVPSITETVFDLELATYIMLLFEFTATLVGPSPTSIFLIKLFVLPFITETVFSP